MCENYANEFRQKLIDWVDFIEQLRKVLNEQTGIEIRPKSDFIFKFSRSETQEILRCRNGTEKSIQQGRHSIIFSSISSGEKSIIIII